MNSLWQCGCQPVKVPSQQNQNDQLHDSQKQQVTMRGCKAEQRDNVI